MRTPQERDVVFLDFEVLTDPSYAGKHNFLYFANKVKELVGEGNADYWNKKRNNKTTIRKIEIDTDNNYVKFLLCFNDSTIPSIPVADIDTDTQRNEKTEEREGSPHTAHLIVKTTPISTNPNIYTGLLEEGEHLKRINVERYFNYLFREIKKKYPNDFEMPSITGSCTTSGEPRKEKYSEYFSVQGKLSKDFREMLETGKIRGLTLVSDHVSNLGIAEGVSIQPRRKELSLMSYSGPLSLVGNAVQVACNIGRDNDYESLRISFSSGKNLTSSVTVNTTNQNVVGDGFLRKERLSDFSAPLIEAEENFNNEIIGKMIDLLGN